MITFTEESNNRYLDRVRQGIIDKIRKVNPSQEEGFIWGHIMFQVFSPYFGLTNDATAAGQRLSAVDALGAWCALEILVEEHLNIHRRFFGSDGNYYTSEQVEQLKNQ